MLCAAFQDLQCTACRHTRASVSQQDVHCFLIAYPRSLPEKQHFLTVQPCGAYRVPSKQVCMMRALKAVVPAALLHTLQAEAFLEVSLSGLQLPSRGPPHTELLDLDPLPLEALGKPQYVQLYRGRFTHFNPIQTQVRCTAVGE